MYVIPVPSCDIHVHLAGLSYQSSTNPVGPTSSSMGDPIHKAKLVAPTLKIFPTPLLPRVDINLQIEPAPDPLLADLGNMINDRTFADVQFCLDGPQHVYAHRCILSARSGYALGMVRMGRAMVGSHKQRCASCIWPPLCSSTPCGRDIEVHVTYSASEVLLMVPDEPAMPGFATDISPERWLCCEAKYPLPMTQQRQREPLANRSIGVLGGVLCSRRETVAGS